jgi:hypothetical protein
MGQNRTHASQQFRGGGTASSSAQGRTGPSPAMADPPLGSPPTSFASKTASSPSTGTCLRTRRPRPNPSAGCRCSATGSPTDPPAPRLGFLAVRCSPGPGAATKHDAELIAASTLLHDIGLTAAFTGEVRFEITIGSGLQLDRSSVHSSSGLKSHLVDGLIDERQ